jgi:hypothetical protein
MEQVLTHEIKRLPKQMQQLFAIFCAEQAVNVVYNKNDKAICEEAIYIAKRYANNKISKEEVLNFRHRVTLIGTNNIAAYAVASALYFCDNGYYAPAWAANAAVDSAYLVEDDTRESYKEKIIQQQWDYYNQLLNLDSTLEDIFTSL